MEMWAVLCQNCIGAHKLSLVSSATVWLRRPGHQNTRVLRRFLDDYDLKVPASVFKYKMAAEFLVNEGMLAMQDIMVQRSTARTASLPAQQELDIAKAEIARLQWQLTAAGRLHGDLKAQLAQAAAREAALQQQKEAAEQGAQQTADQASCTSSCPAAQLPTVGACRGMQVILHKASLLQWKAIAIKVHACSMSCSWTRLSTALGDCRST
jgi:hypothetical protein